jgi:hypothetical protein
VRRSTECCPDADMDHQPAEMPPLFLESVKPLDIGG